MEIRPASRADLQAIAALHKDTFKGLFSGDLSIPCLTALYQSILDNPRCCTFVLNDDNRFTGFISGCAAGDYVPLTLKIRMVFEILKTCRVFEMFRLFKKANYYRRLGISAELISVSILETDRGKGYGGLLLSALEQFFIANGVHQYSVYTDLQYSRGIDFYRAKQFKEIKHVNLFGLEGVFLQKDIKP